MHGPGDMASVPIELKTGVSEAAAVPSPAPSQVSTGVTPSPLSTVDSDEYAVAEVCGYCGTPMGRFAPCAASTQQVPVGFGFSVSIAMVRIMLDLAWFV
jgi:hypothetical protein